MDGVFASLETLAGDAASDDVFELGFVLAGAVSAGAYTAGVIDFFTEALDEYEYARTHGETRDKEHWDGPRHAVKVPVLAGASAGGMTAAISALQWFRETEHVWPGQPVPAPEKNRLYASWVDEIDLAKLLETSDLATKDQRNGGVRSLLCCDILDEIVDRAFHNPGPVVKRDWVGGRDGAVGRSRDALAVFLAVSNLRGVPYSFKLFGGSGSYGMLYHADDVRFLVSDPPVSRAGFVSLSPAALEAPAWNTYRSAALATGAFPGGLAARTISRDCGAYMDMDRVGYYAGSSRIRIPPSSLVVAGSNYEFVCVDGGMIDNEPFELARRYISDGPNARNKRDSIDADRAVILVDPFPNYDALPDALEETRLTSLLPRTVSALMNQARFKPEELALAQDETVFSRFTIVPKRDPGACPELSERYPIASGILGGFGGFLHESFRRHDYLLGRRNAQAFLRWSFVLSERNRLFNAFGAPDSPDREKWYVREPPMGSTASAGAAAFARTPLSMVPPRADSQPTDRALPIIPLVPRLLVPVVIGEEDLPKPELIDLDRLDKSIRTRINKVFDGIYEHDIISRFGSSFLLWAFRWPARRLTQHLSVKYAKSSVREACVTLRKAFS